MPMTSSVFLGLELAVSQRIRVSIADDSLELVVFECVDFVTLRSQNIKRRAVVSRRLGFPTRRRWLQTPFSKKLERTYDLNRIKSIGGSAQYALLWTKSTTVPSQPSHSACYSGTFLVAPSSYRMSRRTPMPSPSKLCSATSTVRLCASV
ncbi:hypothetical protein R3P38DRAFT_2957066, partial [Favolaschia claudopus]